MPKICYVPKTFSAEHLAAITHANAIFEDYRRRGYSLTLRQLFYQFVTRDHFPDDRRFTKLSSGKFVRDLKNGLKNVQPNYNWLKEIMTAGRLAGLVDWDHLEDITRNLKSNSHWSSPEAIMGACADSYQTDKWKEQPHYVEVWVEKDALLGVLQVACEPLDVPYFSCRGYTSISEMWGAAMRLVKKLNDGKSVTLLHLGDHDPSGMDMTRHIEEQLEQFIRKHSRRVSEFKVDRIALNMDQIRERDIPPDPAKGSDIRSAKYIEQYGEESWELDALPPEYINTLITDAVFEVRDVELWDKAVAVEERDKELLTTCSNNWDGVVEFLEGTL